MQRFLTILAVFLDHNACGKDGQPELAGRVTSTNSLPSVAPVEAYSDFARGFSARPELTPLRAACTFLTYPFLV